MAVKKRYSVYHKKTEMPLILYAKAEECAKAMGIAPNSFFKRIMRMKSGKIEPYKWLIYEDEVDDDGDVLL